MTELLDHNGIGNCDAGPSTGGNGGNGGSIDLSAYATIQWVEDQLAALNTSGGTNLSQIQAQITQLQNGLAQANQTIQQQGQLITQLRYDLDHLEIPDCDTEWLEAHYETPSGGSLGTNVFLTLDLPPGDWQIYGALSVRGTAYYWGADWQGVTSSLGDYMTAASTSPTQTDGHIVMPIARYNSDDPGTVIMHNAMQSSIGLFGGWYSAWIGARRLGDAR